MKCSSKETANKHAISQARIQEEENHDALLYARFRKSGKAAPEECLPQQNVLIEAEVKTHVKMRLTRYWKSLSDATFPSPTFATNRRSRSVRTANIISSRRASRANPFCRLRV